MKKMVLFLAFAITIVGLNAGCSKSVTEEIQILSIKDIQSDPLAFTGEITINGVASAFSNDDETFFAVKDAAELMTCKNLFCDAYALLVRYGGSDPLPELADMVDITGSFVQTDNGYFFEITEFKVKQNIMGLLTGTGDAQ